MFVTLLYASAFMFFLAGRKVKHSSLAGIAVILLASLPFSWRALFDGYNILMFAGKFIPDINKYSRNLLCIVFALIVSLVFAAVLMVPANLWSRDLFCIPQDEIKSRKMAKGLFVAASVIPGIVAVWLSVFKFVVDGSANTRGMPYYLILIDNIGIDFLFVRTEWYEFYGRQREILGPLRVANTVYVVLLLVLSVLCIILISRKKVTYKEFTPSARGRFFALPASAISISLAGIILFLTIAQRGYLYWSSNFRYITTIAPTYYSYIYGPYNNVTGQFADTGRYAFCMFVLGLMAAGIIILLISMICMAVRKKIRQNLFSFIFAIVLIILSSGCIYLMLDEMGKFFRIGR